MLPRLGHILYYVGSGLAAAALVSGVFILQHGLDQDYRWVVYVAPSGVPSFVGCSDGPANIFWPANDDATSTFLARADARARNGGVREKLEAGATGSAD